MGGQRAALFAQHQPAQFPRTRPGSVGSLDEGMMMEFGTVFGRMRSYLLPMIAVSALAGSPASVLAQEAAPTATEGQAAPAPAGSDAAPATTEGQAAPAPAGSDAASAAPQAGG